LMLECSVLAICVLWSTALPDANYRNHSFNFLLPFFLVSISCMCCGLQPLMAAEALTNCVVNIVLTLLIAGRLLWISKRIKRSLGYHHAKKYTSVAAMLIECALPYSVTGLFFIICYIIDSPLEEPLISILSQLVVRFFESVVPWPYY
jgi:hypothetical protein